MNIPPSRDQSPYIFVSYSHSDKEIVNKVLEFIKKKGYKIWVDSIISIGNDPFEEIAFHILKCQLALFFLSSNSISSYYCKSEINYAISKNKKIICILLDEFEMPLGLELQLQNTQVLYYYKMDIQGFYNRLFLSKNMKELDSLNIEKLKMHTDMSPKCTLNKNNIMNFKIVSGTLFIDDNISKIESSAFVRRSDIKRIIIGKNVIMICENAFADCTSLTEVVLSSQVKFISSTAFKGCINLKSIECVSRYFSLEDNIFLIHNDHSLIYTISKNTISKIYIPSKIVYIEKYAIEGDDMVENIIIPEGVKYISSQAILNCKKLKVVSLPLSIEYIGYNFLTDCPFSTIECYVNSFAERYCRQNNIPYVIKQ